MQLQWLCEGRGCQPLVIMRHLNQLLQSRMIHLHMFYNIDHIDCQCQFFFTLKYILGLSIFISDGKEERKNDALNVVNFPFSHNLKIFNHTSQI